MPTEAGEFIVGAYLQQFFECSVILYNARPPGGGLGGLSELDVVGLNLKDRVGYLCEVTTHLHGMRPAAAAKMAAKHALQKQYATAMLPGFAVRYMLWSPIVQQGQLAKLKDIPGLELVVNGAFKKAVLELQATAKGAKHDMGNPFMRTLQILEHLRD